MLGPAQDLVLPGGCGKAGKRDEESSQVDDGGITIRYSAGNAKFGVGLNVCIEIRLDGE